MRTTIRLDDELIDEVKARAQRENISVTRLLNRLVRAGLRAGAERPAKRRPFRQRVHALGVPRLRVDKALTLAATLEDEEVVRELALRK